MRQLNRARKGGRVEMCQGESRLIVCEMAHVIIVMGCIYAIQSRAWMNSLSFKTPTVHYNFVSKTTQKSESFSDFEFNYYIDFSICFENQTLHSTTQLNKLKGHKLFRTNSSLEILMISLYGVRAFFSPLNSPIKK